MKTLFVLIFSAFAVNTYAQSSIDTFIYQYKNSKNESLNYYGPVKNGKPNGKGMATYSAGYSKVNFYKGDFKDGLRQGKGILIYQNGTHYDGNWNADTLTGDVKLYNINDGSYFIGKTNKNGDYKGKGIWTASTFKQFGAEFDKNFKDGIIYSKVYDTICVYNRLNGNTDGLYTILVNDKVVKQQWYEKGKLIGDTTVKYVKPAKPLFTFSNDAMLSQYKNSKGVMLNYLGAVKNGVPNGFGRGLYGSNYNKKYDLYIGNYKDGLRSGKGKIMYASGSFFEGEWSNDSLLSGEYFINTSSNFEYYKGQFKHNKKEGKGEFRNFYGTRYVGAFKNDLYEGKGKLLTTSSSFDGSFVAGKKDGLGKEVYGATIKEGKWEKDYFKGTVKYVLPKSVLPFVGINKITNDAMKQKLASLVSTYKADKLASIMDKSLPKIKADTVQKRFTSKISLSGKDTIVKRYSENMYTAYFGSVASYSQADSLVNNITKWLSTNGYTVGRYTIYNDYDVHKLYSSKEVEYVPADKSCGVVVYSLLRNGAYEIRMMIVPYSAATYYDDEDDWWW